MRRRLLKVSLGTFFTVMLLGCSLKYLSGYTTVSNNVSGRELPIYSVNTNEKKVALTFDAAWGNEDTKQILDTLAEQDIHVTFFATGGWVEQYPDEVKAILAAGHDLGNHSQNHKNMSQLSKDQQKTEIMDVHDKVKALKGYEMKLFRPPYGDYDNSVIKTAKECGYYAIQWDVDSLDWKDYGEQSIVDTILGNKDLQNGSIILCHNGAKYTAGALEKVIVGLKKKGYQIVPVSELIYKDHYYLDLSGRQVKD